MPNLLQRLTDQETPMAVLRRGVNLEVMTGRVSDVPSTADIPLTSQPTLALVPFRQVSERGFEAYDDGVPLRVLQVTDQETISLDHAQAHLPTRVPGLIRAGFDTTDQAYAQAVQDLIDQEIGRGEGANFVLHRSYTGQLVGASPRQAVLAYLAALLRSEQGAYWTYAVHLGDVALVGASPERHLTITDGVVTMNPISGTYRHPPQGPNVTGMLSFLTDAKEVDELFMVVDEELKLMATVCPSGGRVVGPFLKPMSRVTHTEYLLEGRTDLDQRTVLRQTMFAPTVTGAPMANACRVIKRREARGRGYYAGVMALFEPNQSGGHNLDAPILIRTAYVTPDGRVKVPVGATVVRHSIPDSEVAETTTKAAGLLTAMGVLDAPVGITAPVAAPNDAEVMPAAPAGPAPVTGLSPPVTQAEQVAQDPRVLQTLHYRNERLAPFWLQDNLGLARSLTGLDFTVIDAEDGFSQMLAHQLRRLGARTQVVGWVDLSRGLVLSAPWLVAGPGPGDPDSTEPRIEALRQVITQRLADGLPFLAVCLSHQILCRHLGLDLRALSRPRQGEQLTDTIFGMTATLGYYNSFTATAPLSELPGVEVARRPGTDEVIGLRGPSFVSLQGHPESALSTNGTDLLSALLTSQGR